MVAAATMVTAATSMITAATAMVAATTTAMTTAAVAATVGGMSRSDPEAADHEGKADSRGDPGYPGEQFVFRFERYLHNSTTSRDRLPLRTPQALLVGFMVGLAERGQRRLEEPPLGLDQFRLDTYV
jgi:hypothetical protein